MGLCKCRKYRGVKSAMVEDKCNESKDPPMMDRDAVRTEIRPVDETEKK